MLNRHMLRNCGHSRVILSNMTGDALVVKVQLNQVLFGMKLKFFSNEMMRNRVQVIVILEMVINIDLNDFNVGVFIPLFRER